MLPQLIRMTRVKSRLDLFRGIIIKSTLMEATEPALQLLPRQRKGVITKQGNSRPTSFFSNIYEIKLKEGTMDIYQYYFDISPELPPDSDGLIEKISKVIAPDLKKNIGLITFRGFMAWGRKEMKTVLSLKAEFLRNQTKHAYEILVKPTKSLSLTDFLVENSENLASVSQVLNINTKQALRKEKMIELYPGSYFSCDTINKYKAEGRLNVWRGFDVTVTVYNKILYLQVDPCSRVLRDESFLETMEADRRVLGLEEMNLKYKDHAVLRKYGSPKIYKIVEIDYKQCPKSQFLNEKEGVKTTYLEYYKKVYGVTIKSEKQPLLKVLADRRINRNKKEDEKIYIYLVPELVCLTGLNDEQRNNFKIMKSLGEYTKLTAENRMKESNMMIGMLQSQEDLMYKITQTPKPLSGFKMNAPQITIGNKREANVSKGTIFLKERVLDPYEFQDMIFCYSVGKYPDNDRADADEALGLLQKASGTFGIKFKEPIWVEVENGQSLQSWYSGLLNEKKKMKNKVDIIFFFVNPKEERFYGDFKKFVALEFNCPCQFSRRKMLSASQKGNLSVASKLAMQMNAKMGHALWRIDSSHPIWREKTVALAGIASSKGKMGTTLAFVGTTNLSLTSYFSDCKAVGGRETVSTALFQGLFTQWIQQWFKKNQKKLPQVLVIYREGLNETQAKFQFDIEVNAIKETISKVKQKAQQPNYDPTIVYLLVNKKPNSRIFEGEGKGKNMSFFNPDPGSIIFEDLSQGFKEFHLASATVREGTCTPVSFKVGYENKPDFPLDAVSELTYNQTYAYFNWTGSVRVPATLQYANKLAKLYSEIGDELKTEDKNSELKSTLFYL